MTIYYIALMICKQTSSVARGVTGVHDYNIEESSPPMLES